MCTLFNSVQIDGPTTVSLSDTLVLPDAFCSPLSVPALVNKGILVLFVQGKAVMSDVEDNITMPGFALRHKDGLFYIGDVQVLASVTISNSGLSR